jgi:methionine-rich copper-binding protein CopC
VNSLHRIAAGIAGASLALLLAVPALAHAELDSSTPRDGAELETPPATIELVFTEGVVQAKSSIRLVGPDGEVGTARPARDGAKAMRLEGLSLGPGAYTVKWTAGAADGHVERGTIAFTVLAAPSIEPSAAPSAPAPPTDAPATEAPASEAPATASPVPATAVPPSGSPSTPAPADPQPAAASGTDILLPIVAALVLVGGIGVFVLRRSRGA